MRIAQIVMFQASIDMMTASATTEEQQHSSPLSPCLHSHPPSPNLLVLPSTPLLSGRRSPSPGPQSSQQENRRRPLSSSGSRAIAVASVETDSVNSTCDVTATTSPIIKISSTSSLINTPSSSSLSETTALVVRHSSCDPGASLALV